MGLSEQDREALRSHWLGETLPVELSRLMKYVPRSKSRRERHLAAREYLSTLSEESARRTRRLVLALAPSAVGLLGTLLEDESKELARRAAVDMMRLYKEFAEEERAATAAEAISVERLMVESLTEDQVEAVLGILGEAGASVGATELAARLEE
jgi:hypothetical protein